MACVSSPRHEKGGSVVYGAAERHNNELND